MAYTEIDDPTIYFTTNLRSGLYGGSDTAFDIGFQPDWIWNKKRSGDGVHSLFDSVRGFGASGKVIYSNNSNAEGTNALIKSVSSTGYTITASSDDTGTMVDWCWKAGGSASSNTDGSITSSVSANTTAGFSIVGWTGTNANATVGHGLGSAPKMIIIRRRESASTWVVYHASTGNTGRLALDETSAFNSNSTFFNNTSPTSTTFSVGTDGGSNGSTDNYIAYCFAEKKGFSKFGSYTGNGNADGTFVYTGFKPAWLMVKQTNTTRDWMIYDNKRDPDNVVREQLEANSNSAADSYDNFNFLSNGFKLRTTSVGRNQSGGTYIYMAFAENPFVTSTGVPATAR